MKIDTLHQGQNAGSPSKNNVTEMSTERILRYDREFLLKLQHDKDVSTKPIILPVIPDLFSKRGKRKKNVQKHYDVRDFQNKEEGSYNDTDDSDMSTSLEMSMKTLNESMHSPETFEYGDKCFIVVDVEGTTDETNGEDNENIEVSGEVKENESINDDDIRCSGNEKIKVNEDKYISKGFRRHELGKGRKRQIDTYDDIAEQERYSKRRRKLSGVYNGSRKINHSYRREKHQEETRHKESKQTRPLLFENGICLQSEVNNAFQDNQEQLLSPVSERSISPYADFTGIFRKDEKETSCFESQATENFKDAVLQTKEIDFDGSKQEKNFDDCLFINGNSQPTNNYFHDTPVFGDTPYEFNNFQQAYYETSLQTRPYFQYNNAASAFPAPCPQYMPHPFVPNIRHPFERTTNMSGQIRGQQYRNNIVVKESEPIQFEKHEYYCISSDTLDSLSKADNNKVVNALFRKLVEAEDVEFTPKDVIGMMENCSPIKVGFASDGILLDFIDRNKGKFIFQKCKGIISPKTDVKLCPEFTNNPSCKHKCTDLHICKYYLLGRCTIPKCKFGHRLDSKHNVVVLKSHNLWGISERHIKKLIKNIHNRNTSTTPLLCKFYNNEGGCLKDVCPYLHLCTHFINDDCKFKKCKRSHDFNDLQVRNVLERHGIFPNSSDLDQIRNLLKSTLAEEKVKLKRELPTNPTLTCTDTEKRFPDINSPGLCTSTEISKNIEIKSNNDIDMNMQSNESIGCDSHVYQSSHSKKDKLGLNDKADFIPLELSFDSESEENILDNHKSGLMIHPEEEVNNQTENENKMQENILNQMAKSEGTKTELTDKRNVVIKSLRKQLLPRWKSMQYRQDETIDKGHMINEESVIKESHGTEKTGDNNPETRSNKTPVENTKTEITNNGTGAEKEKDRENDNCQLPDTESFGHTGTIDLEKRCKQEANNVLHTNCNKESRSKTMPDITFEIIGSGYRVRKNGECWQFVKNTTKTEKNENDINASWEDVSEDDVDKLKDISHIFNKLIGNIAAS